MIIAKWNTQHAILCFSQSELRYAESLPSELPYKEAGNALKLSNSLRMLTFKSTITTNLKNTTSSCTTVKLWVQRSFVWELKHVTCTESQWNTLGESNEISAAECFSPKRHLENVSERADRSRSDGRNCWSPIGGGWQHIQCIFNLLFS